MKRQLWFNSSIFHRIDGEEEETNPGRLGKSLALWIQDRLRAKGKLQIEAPIPEDWGWVVRVQNNPFSLWIGCGNEDESEVRWNCFVEAEPSMFQKLFKRVDPSRTVASLENELEEIIRSDPRITDIKWETINQ